MPVEIAVGSGEEDMHVPGRHMNLKACWARERDVGGHRNGWFLEGSIHVRRVQSTQSTDGLRNDVLGSNRGIRTRVLRDASITS